MNNKLIIALALGDGCIFPNSTNTKATLIIRHSNHQLEYITWKYQLYKELWTNVPKPYTNSNKGKVYGGHQLRTSLSKELMDIRNLMYPTGVKRYSREVLDQLDAMGLAIWFMDDGHCDRCPGRKPTGVISTLGRSPNGEEELIIQQYFKEVWGINCNLNRCKQSGYRIRFPHEEFKKLVEIIKPYVIPSLQYKLTLDTLHCNASGKSK